MCYRRKYFTTILISVMLILSIASTFFVASTFEGNEASQMSSERDEEPAPPGDVSVEHHGDPIMEDPPMMVFDDFSDGDHTTDPEWTVYDGDWSADERRLEGQGTISTHEHAYRAYGRWEYDFSLERTDWDDDYQMMRFYFVQTGDPDPEETSGYFVTVTGEGGWGWDAQINLWRMDEGEMDRLSSVRWEPDTDWHTLAIERNYENEFDLYLDGEDVGSAEDDTYTTSEYKGFLIQGDEPEDRHNIDEIRISVGEDNRISWERSPDESPADPEDVEHYNIYRSENRNGPWDEPIGRREADGSESYEYIDEGRGEADDIYWWYVVRSVGAVEEKNNNSVREPGAPHVTVTTPDGGEVWDAYDEQTIEWEMEEGYDEIDNVALFSSSDSGETWDMIERGLNVTESYEWIVPNYNSTECLVRVRVEDVEGRVTENVSEDHFTISGEPPEPPEDLVVEHAESVGEKMLYPVEELDSVNLEGDIEYLQQDPERGIDDDWYEAIDAAEATELEVLMDTPDDELDGGQTMGVLLRRSDIGDREDPQITIDLYQDGAHIDTLVERLEINDPEGEVYHFDFDAGDLIEPSGERITLEFFGEESGGPPGDKNTIEYGAIEWQANLVGDGDGDEDNLIGWHASPDDPEEVSHYNIYRSEDRDGPWDDPIDSVDADGSEDYSYLDEDRGMADDIYWWYVVRAVGENDMEEKNTNEVQEPFEVDHIEVTPQESTMIAGGTQGYNATAYDEENNEIREVTDETEWSIEGDAGGDWDENVYTSESSGTWDVTGEYTRGGEVFEDNSTLIVEPAEVSAVEIDPEEDQNVVAGQDLVFTASAYDEYGNLITDEADDFTWQNAVDGVFNEEEADEYEVSATHDDVDSVTVTVTVEPDEADHIEIEPEEETIYAGETVTYYSAMYDEYGNMIEDVTEETEWSIEEGAGGDWSENVYESEDPGEWTVTGTHIVDEEEMTAEANLTVLTEEEEVWVDIVEPEEDDVLPPEVTVEWKSGNAEYHEIRLDEEDWRPVGMNSSYTFEDLEEGEHLVEVKAVRADESDMDTVNFTVDPDVLYVDIVSPEDGEVFGVTDVTVEWESGNAEYHEIRLAEKDWRPVGMNTSYTFEDLEEGEHLVEVKAVRAEESDMDTVNFTVDTMPPQIEIISPEDGEILEEDSVTVEWDCTGGPSGLYGVEIRLTLTEGEGENEWIDVSEREQYSFTNLSDGEYEIEINAVDNAGNEGYEAVSFEVSVEKEDDTYSQLTERSCLLPLILLILILLVVIVMVFRWKSGEEEKPTSVKKEKTTILERKEDEKDVPPSEISEEETYGDESAWIEEEEMEEIEKPGEEEFREEVEEDEESKEPEEIDEPKEGEEPHLEKPDEPEPPEEIDEPDEPKEGEEPHTEKPDEPEPPEETEEDVFVKEESGEETKIYGEEEPISEKREEPSSFERRKEEKKPVPPPEILDEETSSDESERREEEVLEESETPEEIDEPEPPEKIDEPKEPKEGEEPHTEEIDEPEEPETPEEIDVPKEFPVPKDFKEPPVPEDIAREDALEELSQLKGVGSSKAENLYENGLESLEDVRAASKEELQEIKGVGPALSEKILDSLEKIEKDEG